MFSSLCFSWFVVVVVNMHWKLFFTLVAAGICIYFIIRWLQRYEMSLGSAAQRKKEIGYAAIAKQREVDAS